MTKKELDLTNADDLKTFHDAVKKLKDIEWFERLLGFLGFEEDVLDRLDKFADETYEEAHKDDEPEFVRPSSQLSTEQGLQLHKLVQEYVDTMIKPYAPKNINKDTMNDAYAGLYEFAAWILNKR